MLYLCICLCELLFICESYFFLKTYQLNGYVISSYLKDVFEFALAFGKKNNLKFTKRLIRLIITFFIVSFLLFFIVIYFIKNPFLRALDVIIILLCCPLLVALCHYINLPIEKLIKLLYIKKAKIKLKKLSVVKIAITGSYGKTSTKNILTTILEKVYKVCPTPKNYNTEMGLVKTILNNLDDHDILIAEMGARHKDDIKKLCQIVKPDHSIITTIGPQHLDTFKNIKTVEDTKYELVENMDNEGLIIFNGDSENTKKLFNKCPLENKFLTCQDNSFAYSENIEVDENGSRFDLIIDNKKIKVKTRLLGRSNIDNIVTASALAYKLGVSLDDIQSAIFSLEPTKHRLELIKNNLMTILDDSYNSNIVGFRQALEVLSNFKGVKIVITPGIVELGSCQSQINFEIGTLIADHADYLIICNDTNKNYILSGAISHNMSKEKIFFANNRKKQQEILKKLIVHGCAILYENDLPDNYK